MSEQAVPSDLQALEGFVVDNDDLLELEQHIGRFNIFDALRIVEREVKHSDFLAWLIDPNESHGQGGLFLRAILMDLFRTARESGFTCPVSPIELDGEQLRGVEVCREWRHIDLLIQCDQPRFVVAIENKIRSGEHSNQLERYRETVETEFHGVPVMYVFLTINGDESSEDDWMPYSYGQLRGVLKRVCQANETSIGEDVRSFLDHYLRLIRGRLMDDPDIVNLCQQIYKNHRQALQLIYEHAGSPAAGLIRKVEEIIGDHPGGWYIVNTTSKKIFFVPRAWRELLPSIGDRGAKFDPRCWIVLWLEVKKTRAYFGVTVWPTKDVKLRRIVVERLTSDPKEFGFRPSSKTTSDLWSRLGSESIAKWSEQNGPDEEVVGVAVKKKLDELVARLAPVPDALRPIIEEWETAAGD